MSYEFGKFVLDTERLELSSGEGAVTLEPQVFALLAYLIRHRERVVSKDELIEEIWGGRIVSDGTLNSRINAARRAVGDSGVLQTVIKTYPKRGFRFVGKVVGDDDLQAQSEPPPNSCEDGGKPLIAVLPFDAMSDAIEQEHFADGLTEDIIAELARISGLEVIARHSSFIYKRQSVTVRQVGGELGVTHVLEGSVRLANSRLRIIAQLIDAKTERNLWAERYDRDADDIFAIQEDVARNVADALQVRLSANEGEQLTHVPTDNREAYDLYKRAHRTLWPTTRQNIRSAENMFQRVIDMAPKFAGGYAGKSFAKARAVLFGHSEDPDVETATAIDLAGRAVKSDPNFPDAHSALGFAYAVVGEHKKAIAAALKAVKLQPGDAATHFNYSRCLTEAGRFDEACEEGKMAVRLDPKYVEGPYRNNVGRAAFLAGHYQDAMDIYEENAAHGGPSYLGQMIVRTAATSFAGHAEKARALLNEILQERPDFSIDKISEMRRNLHPGELEKLQEGLREAGSAQ